MSDPDDLLERLRRLEQKVTDIGTALFDAMVSVAKPGDTVILAFGRTLTDEDIEHLEEAFRPLREHGIGVAFTDQVEGITVARPDANEGASTTWPVSDEDINDWGGA